MKNATAYTPTAPSKNVELLRQMMAGAAGPLVSFIVLFALPLIGAFTLSTTQFAMWTLLSTISTIALSIDFGGTALTMARLHVEDRKKLFMRAGGLSAGGSMLIGAIAMCVWVPFSRTQDSVAFGVPEALAAILVTALAAALRSYLLILAQAALNDHLFGLRTFLTAGQSFVAALVTVVLVFTTRSAWALPLGWLISCAVVLAIGIPLAIRRQVYSKPPIRTGQGDSDSQATFRTFAWSRTVVSILSTLIFQADRWVVGAIGGPAVLATYEVAWRFASLPRFLIQNLSAVLGGSAAASRITAPSTVAALLRRSSVIAGTLGFVGAICSGVLYALLPGQMDGGYDLRLFAIMAFVFLLFGASAPLSVITLGVGMPKLDIPYMALTALLSMISAVIAWRIGDVNFYIYANLSALALGVSCFFIYGPIALRRRLGDSPEAAITES